MFASTPTRRAFAEALRSRSPSSLTVVGLRKGPRATLRSREFVPQAARSSTASRTGLLGAMSATVVGVVVTRDRESPDELAVAKPPEHDLAVELVRNGDALRLVRHPVRTLANAIVRSYPERHLVGIEGSLHDRELLAALRTLLCVVRELLAKLGIADPAVEIRRE